MSEHAALPGQLSRSLFARTLRRFSSSGLLVGAIFFVGSLTPSLIPRSTLAQAALSGVCLAAGYGLGVLLRWLWVYMELPVPGVAADDWWRRIVVTASAVLFASSLWRGQYWGNAVRNLMDLPRVTSSRMLGVGLGAVFIALLLVTCGRGVSKLVRAIAETTARRVPRRVANVLGLVCAALLLIGLIDGVIARSALRVLDASHQQADALIPPDELPPQEGERTGSSQSLVAWDELGRMGRRFVSSTPRAEALREFAGPTARAPLRVYAGLPAADSPEQRARLALEELKRVDAFSRAALVIITPTGTGWVDPAGIESIEYLFRGDIASVAVQYSYLSSPLTLLVDSESGRATARALFQTVYGHWHTLPKDDRPNLYLHGLSLGAFNSERSFDLFELLGDPVDGALWSGPPFAAHHWRALTDARNPGSPEWRPEFRDGFFVRFMNQDGPSTPDDAPWGPMRIVYLQYASDAVTFFDYRGFFREPAWLRAPRAPDISPLMRWYPIVTMMQTALDMPLSMEAPMGFGHVYSPSHYIAAWLQVTGIDDWTAEEIARLQRHLDDRRSLELSGPPGGG